MFRLTVWIVIAALGISATAGAQDLQPLVPPAPATRPTSEEARKILSYAIGQELGQTLKSAPFEITFEILIQGARDFIDGKESKYDEATITAAQATIRDELRAAEAVKMEQEMAAQKIEFDKNSAAGTVFCTENGKKSGVKTLPSGVQVETLTAGTGTSPKATDIVKLHYKGTLIDGTVFDGSRNPDGTGEPITYPLSRFIPGWREGVQQMKIGEKARLVIPQDQAYGLEGSPPVIPPGATLIFEVELFSATAAPAPTVPVLP